MAVGKTFTCDIDPTIDGLALTYIVPATRCDLRCAFCIVTQRNEDGPVRLEPEDYARFIQDIASYVPVRVSGLQGYEPLLDESWKYTRTILSASNLGRIPTSLVTNGTHLVGRVDELADLGLKDITVSLDAPDAEIHDRQRGAAGAFAKTVAGIKAVLTVPALRDRVVVASVLLPKRRKQLDAIPQLLASLGVRYFGVTPLIRIGRSQLGGMVQDFHMMVRDLDHLQDLCDRAGIRFVVDDELSQFRHLADGANRFMIHSLQRPGRLIRLTPSGACSVGIEVLRRVDARTPVWRPALDTPREFISRLGITADLFRESSMEANACLAA
jgi:MoaA/NifB/PqqE/SkfB family radical SAM enzyme